MDQLALWKDVDPAVVAGMSSNLEAFEAALDCKCDGTCTCANEDEALTAAANIVVLDT